MTCPVCGVSGPADRETGYDADEICPPCQAAGWTEALVDGEMQIINENDEQFAASQADPRR